MIDNKKYKITSCNDKDITSLERQLLQEEVLNLPKINKDEINFSTLYIYDLTDKYETKVIIRNTSKLPLDFKDMVVGIVDENEKVLGTCTMNLSFVGIVEPMSAKVANIYIDKNLIGHFNVIGDCKLRVGANAEIKNSVMLKISSFPENILEYEKVELEDYVKNMSTVMDGSTAAKVYKISKEVHDIYAIIVLINATDKKIIARNLKVNVHNELGFIAAKGFIEKTDVIMPKSIAIMKHKINKDDYMETIDEISGFYGTISN